MKKLLFTLIGLLFTVSAYGGGGVVSGPISDIGPSAVTVSGDLDSTVVNITAGSGTGVTIDAVGRISRVVYKVTVTQDHWIDAAVTQDLTIATLPAKSLLTGIVADITEQFACTAVCTSSTLSMVVGQGAGGAEYLDSFDVDAATAQFGNTDAERGASLAGVVNGVIVWGSTRTIIARLTSGTGNLAAPSPHRVCGVLCSPTVSPQGYLLA